MQNIGDTQTLLALRGYCMSASGHSRHWLYVGISCLTFGLLSGCADQPEATAPPAPLVAADPPALKPTDTALPPPIVKAAPKARRKPPAHEASKSQVDKTVTPVEPKALIGKDPSAVQDLLGLPARISHRDVSLVWSYKYSGCEVELYFYPDIKTSVFHVLQYAVPLNMNESTDPSPLCVQQALLERGNGTN